MYIIYNKVTKPPGSEVIHWEVPIIIGLAFSGIELLVANASSCMLVRSCRSFEIRIFVKLIDGSRNILAVQETLFYR